jgi:hypothetical protein
MYVGQYAYSTGVAADAHHRGYQLRLYNFGNTITGYNTDGTLGMPPVKGSAADENGNEFEEASTGWERTTLGNAVYFPNGEGTTNHTFSWTLTPDEVEYLTHHTDEPVKVTRWFRFISKDKSGRGREVDNYSAPYPYIWVKMTMVISRTQLSKLLYKTKIENYWYNWNPNADMTTSETFTGWTAWLIDIEAPRNGETTRDERWIGLLSNALLTNKATISQEIKYYFAPKPADGLQITAQNGVTYTITPKNDGTGRYIEPTASRNIPAPLAGGTKDYGNGSTWNKMFCKYVYGRRSYNNVYGDGTQFIPADRYIKSMNDNHLWKEEELEATLQDCVVLYDDEVVNGYERNCGVFNDSLLYASYRVGSTDYYTPIARIVQQKQLTNGTTNHDAGAIELIHWLPLGSTATTPGRVQNVVLYDVLNALGYPLNADGTCDFDHAQKFINQQLRAWVGVIAKKDCNRAQYVEQEKYDDNNIATFLASWERPINLKDIPAEVALDANTNENIIYLIDYLKLYDWRGDYTHQGYMYDDPNLVRNENHWWFWAYYNVKGIEIDLRPGSVYTNLHKKERADNQEWVVLSSVTNQLKLEAWRYDNTQSIGAIKSLYGEGFITEKGTSLGNDLVPVPAPNGWELVQKGFNSAAAEPAIEAYMGLRPQINDEKAKFGAFYYANNGINVTEFDIAFPITIFYEWGYIQLKPQFKDGKIVENTGFIWHINTTHGH